MSMRILSFQIVLLDLGLQSVESQPCFQFRKRCFFLFAPTNTLSFQMEAHPLVRSISMLTSRPSSNVVAL